MKPLLNGEVFSHSIDGWSVSWESYENYRHWCYQVKDPDWKNLLVIMFNPGSLSRDGANLSKDTTLRILREVCGSARLNTMVINLFDFSSPSPETLFENWEYRDGTRLVYEMVLKENVSSYIMAYGDYENYGKEGSDILERISCVRKYLIDLDEIELPKNRHGTPKHPMSWQREKIKPVISEILKEKA